MVWKRKLQTMPKFASSCILKRLFALDTCPPSSQCETEWSQSLRHATSQLLVVDRPEGRLELRDKEVYSRLTVTYKQVLDVTWCGISLGLMATSCVSHNHVTLTSHDVLQQFVAGSRLQIVSNYKERRRMLRRQTSHHVASCFIAPSSSSVHPTHPVWPPPWRCPSLPSPSSSWRAKRTTASTSSAW